VACDVRVDFVAAAEVFAPQKGASPREVELLRRRLVSLVDTYRQDFGVDVSELEGAGAAGGLAGGLAALGAVLESGFEMVAEHVELLDAIETADLVVTGEGFVDAESFDGKVVGGVADMCEETGVPLLIVAGAVYDGLDERDDVVSLTGLFGEERSFDDTLGAARQAVADWVGAHMIAR
jgi:glycerate kinase